MLLKGFRVRFCAGGMNESGVASLKEHILEKYINNAKVVMEE